LHELDIVDNGRSTAVDGGAFPLVLSPIHAARITMVAATEIVVAKRASSAACFTMLIPVV